MKHVTFALFALILVGCASDPKQRAIVAELEVARLSPPLNALSEYRNYELKPIAMSAGVIEDEDKLKIAQELGTKLNTRIIPLLDSWKAQKKLNDYGPDLIIEPKVEQLRIISPGARFWLGAFMGDSFIDLDLKLTDSATGQIIANPRVQKNSGAMGGAWSFGATDRNLLDYITDIAHRYLEVNYTRRPGGAHKSN
jgi:hypothetical protein